MSQISILAVDDEPVIGESIASFLEAPHRQVSIAANGREALTQFKLKRPDVTLMDLQMPDMGGIEAIIAIRVEFPNARIIVLTTYTGDVQVLRALKAGARAYLLKGRVNTELLEVIRAVHRGQKRIPPEIAAELADHATEDDLSQREIEVLRLVATGNGNREIAAKLSITEETIKNHVTHILAKLGANDRTHA